jgi:hypothetical protein
MKKIGQLERPDYEKLEGLSQSDLKLILKSPLHYTKREEMRKVSESMELGKALHEAVLRPAYFKDNYLTLPNVMPDGEAINKRKKAHREYLESYKLENADKICLSEQDMDDLTGMLNSLMGHEIASMLLTGGEPEVCAQWEYADLKCKGTFDKIHEKHPIFGRCLVELKTSRDGSPDEFAKEVFNRGYDFQMAYYEQGFKADRHFCVVVENKFPYPVAIYDMSGWLDVGLHRVNKAIDRYKWAMDNNAWTNGYTESVEILQPKSWVTALLKEETY